MPSDRNHVNAGTKNPGSGSAAKTYAVYGLMEYTAVIPVGKGSFHVRFSGGSMTSYGVIPATYTTGNPAIMKLIETSLPFRRGVIRMIA